MDGANLDWNWSLGADSYNIYRSETENGNYIRIASNVEETHYYDDSVGLDEYWYRVRAVNENGEGPLGRRNTNKFWRGTFSGLEGLGVYFEWNNVDNADNGYTIKRANTLNGSYSSIGTKNQGECYFNEIPSMPGTYWYKVEAKDGSKTVESAAIPITFNPDAVKAGAISLSENVWAHGELSSESWYTWYKFEANDTDGYSVYINNKSGGPARKTGEVFAGVFDEEGNRISVIRDFNEPAYFQDYEGTVYILAACIEGIFYGNSLGTYAVKFEN